MSVHGLGSLKRAGPLDCNVALGGSPLGSYPEVWVDGPACNGDQALGLAAFRATQTHNTGAQVF